MDFFNPATLLSTNQEYTYLSGIPAPSSYIPPLPYSTTPAPATTPIPTCAPAQGTPRSLSGVRFGDFFDSRVEFDHYIAPSGNNNGVKPSVGLLFYNG